MNNNSHFINFNFNFNKEHIRKFYNNKKDIFEKYNIKNRLLDDI